MDKRVLVISPHADDATIFIGGTISKLSSKGYRVFVARVTNDDYDAFGLDKETTIKRNRQEAEKAYKVLGVNDVIHMGYESDCISNIDYHILRGDIVNLIRVIRPYEIYTFDKADFQDDNMDHKIIASATAEALWIASFPLHYKEQLNDEVKPYSVPIRKAFTRQGNDRCKCEDITDVIDIKIKALKEHNTAAHNIIMQALCRAESYGADVNYTISDEEFEALIEQLTRANAEAIGSAYGIKYGELIAEEDLGLAQYFIHKWLKLI